MPGNPQKSIVDGLILTQQQKDNKLFDALSKMNQDIDKVYRALFDGLLPATSGRLINLTETPESSFPETTAFTDKENIFNKDQEISKEFPVLSLEWNPGLGAAISGKKTRLMQIADGTTFLGSNLYFDGADWLNDDDAKDGAALQIIDDEISFIQYISDVIYTPLVIDHDRIIRIGNPDFYSDADEDEIVIPNSKKFRATDSTSLLTYPLFFLDANDIFQIGTNPVGATTGEGNVGIPRAVGTDLPAAGVGRNGIIIINKTTPRLCFYVNNLRYYVAGTAF